MIISLICSHTIKIKANTTYRIFLAQKKISSTGASRAELLTLPEHLSSPPVFSGVRVTRSLILCVISCRSLFVPFILFLLAIVLSVRRFTDFDYPFDNFKLFFSYSTNGTHHDAVVTNMAMSHERGKDIFSSWIYHISLYTLYHVRKRWQQDEPTEWAGVSITTSKRGR